MTWSTSSAPRRFLAPSITPDIAFLRATRDVAGIGKIFLDLIKLGAVNRFIRIFLGVDVALLQCRVDILDVHRHRVCAEGPKGSHVGLAWLHAYPETFEVAKRLHRPLRVGHVPRTQCHPAKRNESF